MPLMTGPHQPPCPWFPAAPHTPRLLLQPLPPITYLMLPFRVPLRWIRQETSSWLRLSWASPLHIMYNSALAQPHYMDVCLHVCLIHWTMSSSRVELGPSHFSILTPGIVPTHSRYVSLRQSVFIQSKQNWTIDWLGPALDWEGITEASLPCPCVSSFIHP